MKRSLILILLLTTALLLLCACGGRSISADLDSGSKRETEAEDRMENADTPAGHPADSGEKLGEPIRTAWLDAIDESGSAPSAPDAAGILSAALAENPGLSAAELEEILLSALESGSYEMAELPDSVKNFEPHLALYGGRDGLDFYRAIAKHYAKALKPGGYLAFEFGMGQGDEVCSILTENGYTILERTKDFNDRERAVLAQCSRKDD